MTLPTGPSSPPESAPSSDGSAGRIIANAGWLGLQPLALNALGILSTAYIARRLGLEAYGRFNFGLALVMTAGPVTDLGLRSLAVRRLAQEGTAGADHLGDLISLRLLLATLTAVALLFLAPAITDAPSTAWVVRIAAITLIPIAMASTLTDAMVAAERARAVSLANMTGGLVLTAVSVAAVAAGGKEAALAASYAVGPVVTALMLRRAARASYGRVPLRWNPRQWRELIRESFPFFRVGVLGSVLQRLDVLVVGRFFGAEVLGGYAAAVALVDRILIIPDSVSTAMLPTLARIRQRGRSIGRQLSDLLVGLQLLTWPLTLATIAAAPAILTLIFGVAYRPAWPVLAVAILALPLAAAGNLTGEALIAEHREQIATRTAFRSQLIALLLIYPLTLFAGPVGTRAVRIIGGIGVLILRWPTIRDEYPTVRHDHRWRTLAGVLLVAAAGHAVTPLLWGRVAAPLAWSSAVTVATFLAIWRVGLIPHQLIDAALRMMRPRDHRNVAP